MNVTTILLTGLLALAVFSVDAWSHADVINLTLTIPKGLGVSETSIGDAVAENIFLSEIAEIDAVPTFVTKARVHSTNDATAISLISDMLGLRQLTQVVQHVTGVTPVTISGSLTKRAERYQLVLVSNAQTGPEQRLNLMVESLADEPIPHLIRRAALQTMLHYDDYLVCLYLLTRADGGAMDDYVANLERPGLDGLDLLIQRRLQARPKGLAALAAAEPQSRRDAMFTNLRGIIALEQGDPDKAAGYFEAASRLRPDFAIAHLNLAFVRIHQDRYQDALDISRRIVDRGLSRLDPVLQASAYTTGAVAAWGLKHFDDAAAQFERAVAVYPGMSMANLYWSEMLAALGRREQAAVRLRSAVEKFPFFENYAETAMLHFRLSPADNSPLTRF